MIYVASVGQNRLARADSERLVQALMAAEAKKMASVAKDYSWWDDAVTNLLISFDPTWAAGNVGWYLTDNFDVKQTVVLSGDDRVIYAQRDGKDIESPALDSIDGVALLPLAQAARGPKARRRARDDTIEPVPVSGHVRVGDHLWAVGASLLTVEGEDDSPVSPDEDAVLLVAKQIDGEVLAGLADDYGLTDLQLLGPGDGAGETLLPVIGFSGEVVGRLTWKPALPGTALLSQLIPAGAAGALLTLGLLLAFIRRSERVVAEIERSAHLVERKNALLGERERELRTLVDNVADGIVTADDRGMVLTLNPSASRILGWNEEEARGRPVLALLLGKDDAAGADWAGQLARMAGQTATGRRRDGSQFQMELSVGAAHDGQVGRTVVALRDVTERSRAQATLNLLATPMLVLDGSMRPLLANASANQLLQGADGLSLVDGAVQVWQPGEMAQFRLLVDAAMGKAEAPGRDTGIMTVSRPSGRQPLAMLVSAMRPSDVETESPLAAVFLRDPEHRWEVPAKVLQELYDLTPAESRVAIELVNGSSPKEVARIFNVSVNTVRNQIKQTYRKTGTSRQAQLVALMLTTAALVSDRLDDVA